MNSAIHEEKNVKFNSLANGQRMKTKQNWGDVISSEGFGNESGRRILLMQQSQVTPYSTALPWSPRDVNKA